MIYLASLLLVMVLVFPSVGARGAWFHSSAAMMPILWASAPAGLAVAINWMGKRRRWKLRQARLVLGNAAIGLAIVLTVGLTAQRVIGPRATWGGSHRIYAQVAQRLTELDSDADLVSVNNPPGWYLASGIPAVVNPNGDAEILHQAVDRFGVDWVILERNHPEGLNSLYESPESLPWLENVDSIALEDGSHILLLRVRSDGER
jgi:hypothetical protein